MKPVVDERPQKPDSRRDLATAQLDVLMNMSAGVVFLDLELRFLRINQVLADMHGIPIEAHLGRTVAEVLPPGEGRDAITQRLQHVIATGQPLTNLEVEWEAPGSPPRRKFSRAGYFPVHDGVEVVGACAYVEDITAQKLADEARRASEDWLRRLFESGLIGILVWERKGGILDANGKFLEMVGYSHDDLKAGRLDWAVLLPPKNEGPGARASEELLTAHASSETELVRKDGTQVPVLRVGTFFEGSRTEGVTFFLDITVQKRAQDALRRANDELERRVWERTLELKKTQAQVVEMARAAGMAEIASNVLHNVGNVLTSAVINTEQARKEVESSRVSRMAQLSTLLEEHRDNLADFLTRDPRGSRMPAYISALSEELLREQENLRGYLETLSRHIEHIRAIVQVQQTYAKASLILEECDLSQLIEDALHIQAPALQRHGISVTREFTPLAKVRVDKHKVLQILINLISNARHALDGVPEGQRRLLVRLTTEGQSVRIQVVDNGTGIAPEIRGKLFSHGFTTRKEGHGFGLHSSALTAQILGGHLLLESEGPGRGATATLELPLQSLLAR
ncbi:MAG: PAS domain S-box protein [Myxococcaceae bacterium]|nr:PAS domain S-box protein [Myxococcaceae bacterium]